MRHAQPLRVLALAGLATWGSSTGCTHNHYYGAPMPVCAEPAVIGGYGAVCELPTQVGGATVVAQVPARGTIISGIPRSTRVVSSSPIESQPVAISSGRNAWRRSDSDPFATTRVDGDLDTLSR